MRKPTRRQHLRSQRLARRRDRRRQISIAKARRRRAEATGARSDKHSRLKIHGKMKVLKQVAPLPLCIEAPRTFGLRRKPVRDHLLRFLRHLRKATLVQKRTVVVDLTDTTHVYPEGAVLFMAELDRINRITAPHSRIRCRIPKNNVIEQLLQHLGLLKKMKAVSLVKVTADNVRNWKVGAGVKADGEATLPIWDACSRLFGGEKAAGGMFTGLGEAMTNSVQHAYIRRRKDGTPIQGEAGWWWVYEERDGMLFVAFCDLGIGIRRSLLEGNVWSVRQIVTALGTLRNRKDSDYIQAAIKLGRTRTHLPYRGKGTLDLKAVFEHMPKGWLQILSGRGAYRYQAPGGEERVDNYPTSIYGTIISWHLPIPTAPTDADA